MTMHPGTVKRRLRAGAAVLRRAPEPSKPKRDSNIAAELVLSLQRM
jgi:hypothetical protein